MKQILGMLLAALAIFLLVPFISCAEPGNTAISLSKDKPPINVADSIHASCARELSDGLAIRADRHSELTGQIAALQAQNKVDSPQTGEMDLTSFWIGLIVSCIALAAEFIIFNRKDSRK